MQFNQALFNQQVFGGTGEPPGRVVEVGNGLLYPALRKAQVTIGPGRTPSPAQFQDALDELARLTGSLNCDRLNIYSNQRWEFPLQTGQKTYTIGADPTGETTADFNAPRPQGIESANIIYPGGSQEGRYPLALITVLQWSKICMQDLPQSIPEALYNDRAYPLSTLYLFGQPMEGCRLELFYWLLIPTFQSVSDVVLLPPGYEDALVLNLAVRLAPHFQRNAVPPDVREDAQKALLRLESINAPQPVLEVGICPSDGGFDIYSGGWRR
jgi:hypothetical protein